MEAHHARVEAAAVEAHYDEFHPEDYDDDSASVASDDASDSEQELQSSAANAKSSKKQKMEIVNGYNPEEGRRAYDPRLPSHKNTHSI